MCSTLTLKNRNKKNSITNGIDVIKNSLSICFQKLLDEALKEENAILARKLEAKAIDELINLFSDILLQLSVTFSCISVQDVKKKLQNGDLGIYSKLIPPDDDLKELESVVCRSSKKKKQYFHGPVDKVYLLFKEMHPNIKPLVAYFVYGVAEKMIYSILKYSVYYEESTQLNDPIIQETTIQTVIKLHELQKTVDLKMNTSNNIPSDYDKCVDELRNFLQSSYDQCNTILRVFFDPIKKYLPDSIMQVPRLVNSFINIFRALLESIEDMNDHVSSGGSGRTSDQGLIGYCFEGPAEDYLLEDFTTYTAYVINQHFLNEILSVVENEEAVKVLMNKGRNILQIKITNSNNANKSGLSWIHKGCVHCNGLQTGSMVNEAYVTNEHISGNIQNPDMVEAVSPNQTSNTDCNYLLNCYIYLFPRLLLVPIFQFLYLEEIIKHLYNLSYNEEDMISFKDVSYDFHIIRQNVINIIREVPDLEVIISRLSCMHLKEFKPLCVDLNMKVERKVSKLEDFEILGTNRSTELSAFHNSEFIMSGKLFVQSDNKKMINRMVYLFNNVLLVFKLHESGWKQPLSGQSLKLKRIIPLDYIHMIDVHKITSGNVGSMFEIHLDSFAPSNFNSEDCLSTLEHKSKFGSYYGFRMQFQDQKLPNGSMGIPTLSFATYTYEEKADWMACLLQIQTNKLFEKYIKELPKQEIPLRLPYPSKYKFAEPDSEENIRFEKSLNDDFLEIIDEEDCDTDDMPLKGIDYHFTIKKDIKHPQIKYATLHKLIERLTYHTYHDLRSLHMFLLAYRRFTTPEHLLDLLIDRFNIPYPDFSPEERQPEWKDEPSPADQMLKRFKNSYQRRVQRRVIWVILWWVQNPGFFRYDFANKPHQREKLLHFINGIKTKELQIACQSLREKCSNNESICGNYDLSITSPRDGPMILNWDIAKRSSDVRIKNVHPVELARQITLFEWDLYHRIQYWEVEGKEATTENTPNLNRSKEFSNKLRNWFVYSILYEEHPDDRAAVIMRVADIMMICDHWHNLQGSQEARAALISASVFRLKKSFNYIIRRYRNYKNVFNSMRKSVDGGKLNKPIYTQEYEEKIRKIEESNPAVPCVPFIAFGTTTKLIHAELKSHDTINIGSGNELINFRKHLRLSQIIERYLSFQKLPYEFRQEPIISGFLETLDPFAIENLNNDDDFEKLMFEISERYEPRDLDSNAFSESFQDKERQFTKIELKYSEQLNNMSLKEKLDIQKQMTLNIGSNFSNTTTSRSASTMSSSTFGSEPTTPTNSSSTSVTLENHSLKFDNYNLERSPPYISHHRYFQEDIELSTPPLPPRAKDMTPQFNMSTTSNPATSTLNTPPLPPRPMKWAPPPIPARLSKE